MRQLLKLHPDSLSLAVGRIEVDVQRPSLIALVLRYIVTGSIDDLLVPSAATSERADGLWQHTCFEAFIGGPSGYLELNFSPSGQWAAYRFDSYRNGMVLADLPAPVVKSTQREASLETSVRVLLPQLAQESRLVGLSAVIEEKGSAKSYWALAHPPGAPDFHHQTCFALELPAATQR